MKRSGSPAGPVLALAAWALIASCGARADLYGFVDERGVTHYSNIPHDPRYQLLRKNRRDTAWPGSSLVITTVPGASPRRTMRVNPAERRRYAPMIASVAREQGLDPALLHAVIAVESGYNASARSPKGAIGLMQLMPDTARRYGVANIWDPRQNLSGGARYLRDLIRMFGNNLTLALAAYNAGEGAVLQHGNRVPPYAETRNYVPKVLQYYRVYAAAR